MKSFQEELIIGISCLAGGWLYRYYGLMNLAESGTMGQNQAGIYIQLIGFGLICCGIVSLDKAVLSFRTKGKASGSFERKRIKRIALAAAITTAYVAVLDFLGFILSTILAGAALLFLMGERSRWKNLAYPVAFALVLYVLFDKILQLQLPSPMFL